jgi:hypothetical protein
MSYDKKMTQEEKDIFHDRTERIIGKCVLFDETNKIAVVEFNKTTGEINIFVGEKDNWKEFVALNDLVKFVHRYGKKGQLDETYFKLKPEFFENKIWPGKKQFLYQGMIDHLNEVFQAVRKEEECKKKEK